MPDLLEWLASRKLEKLAQVLLDNEVDLDLLFDLTDDDMREIGLSFGARKRLKTAIDEARESRKAGGLASARSGSDPERRHLTTMFVDLVGSTALSGQLDPEDMREVITSYQNAVAGVVTRFEGHVAKYMGDGVLCYFGWPQAHENDAGRAVRAALEIVEALRSFSTPTGEPLTVRLGIASGLVVVGDGKGDGSGSEESVIGETPNLAARLQTLAEPGQILIAESTHALLRGNFETVFLGEMALKGIGQPVPVWRVDSVRSSAIRYDATVLGAITPMVGRDAELRLIMERWERACAGEGQLSVLIGEAGIGKSRLMRAAIDEISKVDHHRISYHCSPYHSDSSFHPLIQQLMHAAGITGSETNNTKLDKLEASLLAADARIFAALLEIDATERYGPLGLTPQQFRNRILEESARELVALSRQKPVLFAVEDAHWIDASSLAVLEACLDKIANEQAMILVSARPTFAHGFGGHPIVGKLTLNRLGSDQAAGIISRIAGGKSLPEELISQIVLQTDGVPLFIEELTKTVLESGDLRETESAYELTGPLSGVTIPATLHDSLMARIDRLQPIKEIAQMAACIGRHFDQAMLARIARVSDATLEDALKQLEESELIFRRGVAPDAHYVFKHALVRDVAYESLLKTRRQEIHRRIFDVLDVDPAAPPELAAHHATKAGLTEKAILLWAKAGAVAQVRPAYDEAANHFRMALRMVAQLSDKPEWREKELSYLVQVAQILVAKDGYASVEASDAFSKAVERINATDDPELKVAISYGAWIAPYIGNQIYKALDFGERLLRDLAREPDPIPRLIARRMRAATLVVVGRPAEAEQPRLIGPV
jgi:class 3 adenylate cyclase/ABC-type transport system involved in cytochrome c biogenesis ATPase subunit